MIRITLYSTLGCHLCEEAYQIIQPCVSESIVLSVVDIALDDDLTARFSNDIPVIEFDHGSLLFWPFSLSDIQSELQHSGS